LVVRAAQGAGECPGDPDVLVALAGRRQPGIAGKLARRRLYDERLAEKGWGIATSHLLH
jgi:hypothetical protein